jgi:hypothetical protein
MEINVKTLNDDCINCPQLDIGDDTCYCNNEILSRTFYCTNLERCRKILKILKKTEGQE